MSSEVIAETGGEIVRAPQQQYALMPVVSAQVLAARRTAILDAMGSVMQDGVHYGVVPGARKPSLLKAGAEELCVLFGLCPIFRLEQAVEDFTGEHHGGEAYLGYTYSCELWRGDWRVATASGACNSWEVKYRYRDAQIACPECGREAVRRSRDDEGGWFCWRKLGGCGRTFEASDHRISAQPQGRVPNPDVADLQNTLVKMAQKRSLVAATLVGTGASAHFTQDAEDTSLSGGHGRGAGSTEKVGQNGGKGGSKPPRAAVVPWLEAAAAAGVDPRDWDLQARILTAHFGEPTVVNARTKLPDEYYAILAADLPGYLAQQRALCTDDAAVAAAVGGDELDPFDDPKEAAK